MTQELQTIEHQAVNPAQPAAAYLAGLRSDVGRATMRSELNKIARLMGLADWQQVDWSTLNAANVMAIMAKVEGAPATRNKTLAALKGIAKAAWRLGLMDSEELARINDVHGDTGSREITGREIEPWEIAALLRACAADPTPAGIRDKAIFAVAHKTGARRAELASMPFSSVFRTDDGSAGSAGPAAEIRVIGKRNKQRTLFVDNGALNSLIDWLQIRGNVDGPLFCAISQTGIIDPEHQMSTTALHKILTKRAAEAGITNLTWHDFRRTFASTLLDAGADISVVAGMMGHESVNTTARYDRRPAEAKRKAARKISTPYFKQADRAK